MYLAMQFCFNCCVSLKPRYIKSMFFNLLSATPPPLLRELYLCLKESPLIAKFQHKMQLTICFYYARGHHITLGKWHRGISFGT